MKKVNYLLCLILVLVTLGCDTDTVAPAPSGYKGYIYFSKDYKIYRLNLANNSSDLLFTDAYHPDITKNGEILCVDRGSRESIVFANATGFNRKKILLAALDSKEPRYLWSFNYPRISYDQKFIAYQVGGLSTTTSYIIKTDDGSLVTEIGDIDVQNGFIHPSWAPDGSIIVEGSFSSNAGLYKVSKDFSKIEKFNLDNSNLKNPSVSPDGKFIAFISNDKLLVMNFDGTNIRQLYISEERFSKPTWSPDSKYIAAIENSGQIYIFDPVNLITQPVGPKYSVENFSQLSWVY